MMNPAEMRKLSEWAPLPILITVILWFAPPYIVGPKADYLAQEASALSTTLKGVRNSFRQQAESITATHRLATLSGRLAMLDQWLPPEDQLPVVIEILRDLADVQGLIFESGAYSFAIQRPKDGLPKVEVAAQVRGEYPALRRFVQTLEGLPFPLLVTEIAMNDPRSYSISLLHLVKP
jgi:Tfp pilus assembly protein PilO